MSVDMPDKDLPEPQRRTDLGGPAIEQPTIDMAVNETFLDIAEHEGSSLSDAIEKLEGSGAELIEQIHRLFSKKITAEQALTIRSCISEAGAKHIGNFLVAYQCISAECSDEELVDSMSVLFKQTLEELNDSCKSLVSDCVDCTNVTYNLEAIKNDMEIALLIVDEEDIEEYGDLGTDIIAIKKLSSGVIDVIQSETNRIVGHAPNDSEYKKFNVKGELPRVILDVGKIAVGTAIGVGFALFMNRQKDK